MRQRLVLAALVPAVVTLAGMSTASAAPVSGAPANAHGQCVSESAKVGSPGGRSAVAKHKGTCTPPLTCAESGAVDRDSARNTVTVSAKPATLGSSLECATGIRVVEGLTTISFDYEPGADTVTCGNGAPRLFVVIDDGDETTDDVVENTHDGNADCIDGAVSYTIQTSGTVTKVGFVHDIGTGSVTYSNAKIGGVTLNI